MIFFNQKDETWAIHCTYFEDSV